MSGAVMGAAAGGFLVGSLVGFLIMLADMRRVSMLHYGAVEAARMAASCLIDHFPNAPTQSRVGRVVAALCTVIHLADRDADNGAA